MTKGKKLGLSLAAELGVSMYQFNFSSDGTNAEPYNNIGGMFPVFFKINFYPHQFVLSPYGGGYYFFDTGEKGMHHTFGWLAGIEAGTKCGNGILALTARVLGDLVAFNIQDIGQVWQYTGSVGVAYKFGLTPRPQKTPLAMEGGW